MAHDEDPPGEARDVAGCARELRRLPIASGEDPSARYGCQYCQTKASFTGEAARMPKTCPTRTHAELATDVSSYLEPDRAELMRAADATPFTPAPERRLRNRVEELVEFSKRRGYERIGVAFCVSMLKEAQTLSKILTGEGLSPHLVCCRVGAVDYEEIGLQKAHPERFAAICNPVAQAKLLAEARVDLVVQMGLCIGHDIILQEESRAPVTTLVVKDRALDHAPMRALRP